MIKNKMRPVGIMTEAYIVITLYIDGRKQELD